MRAFQLTDPVSRFIPSFADVRVYTGGSSGKPVTVPAVEPVRIWHLLTHTSGLTYGFHYVHPVDAIYRAAGYEFGAPPGMDLAAACDGWAALPLQFQPGSEWNYSVSTDVLGRVIEVASGMSLDRFFAERICSPLGMTDTAFLVPEAEQDRLGALYAGASEEVAGRLANYGRGLGLAFQIADDLLDLVGREETAGKTLGTDLAQQKLTLPVIHCLNRLPASEAAK